METNMKGGCLIQVSEFHWSREKVLALIDSMEEFFEDFYDKSLKKKFIWQNVAEHMNKKGYTCSSVACEKKWRDLKNNYAQSLQRQLQGDTSSTFEYFSALHHILGQEIDTADQTQNQDSSDSEPAEFDDIIDDVQDDEIASPPIEREEISSSPTIHKEELNFSPTVQSEEITPSTFGRSERTTLSSSGQREKRVQFKSPKELKRSSILKDDTFGISKSKGSEGKTILERIRHIESSFNIKQRLEKLEARVEASQQQRETTRTTNALLVQVLAELRRINADLKEERSVSEMQGIQVQPHNSLPSSPSKQEFIIVEAYPDQE